MAEYKVNSRGFAAYAFNDFYKKEVIVRKASHACMDAIWLGLKNTESMIMAKDAHIVGIYTEKTVGWIEFPLPKEVLVPTTMLLTKEMAADLIPILQGFVDSGDILPPEKLNSVSF